MTLSFTARVFICSVMASFAASITFSSVPNSPENRRCVVPVLTAMTCKVSCSLLPWVGMLWKWRTSFRVLTGSLEISFAVHGIHDLSPLYSSIAGGWLDGSWEARRLTRRCFPPLHSSPFFLHLVSRISFFSANKGCCLHHCLSKQSL